MSNHVGIICNGLLNLVFTQTHLPCRRMPLMENQHQTGWMIGPYYTVNWWNNFKVFVGFLFLLRFNCRHNAIFQLKVLGIPFNPLSTNITKWSNTLKQFISKLPTNCLSVFDHFMILALEGLKNIKVLEIWLFEKYQANH